jgi:hypothetical protein
MRRDDLGELWANRRQDMTRYSEAEDREAITWAGLLCAVPATVEGCVMKLAYLRQCDAEFLEHHDLRETLLESLQAALIRLRDRRLLP